MYRYILEAGSLRIGRPERPELHVVGGSSPYIWIGSDKGGCFGTRDLKDLKGLYRELKKIMEADEAPGWIVTTCKHYRGCEDVALSCQKYIDGETSCMRPATIAEVLSGQAVRKAV